MRTASKRRLLTLRRIAAAAAICCLAAQVPTLAQPENTAALGAGARAEAMVLRVSLNSEDKGDRFVSRTADGDFLVKESDLRELGFKEPVPGTATVLEGERYISLKSMPGVTYNFDARRLVLAITADPQLLPVRRFGSPLGLGRGFIPRENSGFVNYALDYAGGNSVPRAIWTATGEAGWRQGDYLFLTNGATVQSADGAHRFVRLMSSATRDDREGLSRWIAGDFFTPSRELSNGVNLGGFSVSKLYGLNPYLVQFPTQTISGQVALPSQIDVYMDGQKIRTENVNPGQFQLNDVLAYGGARNVQVVVRDSFGRTQTLDYSFYFSDRPLQQGLHEYSYNVGAFRRGYGVDSDRYGPAAFSMFHRYGFTNALTLGIRAEGAQKFLNGGPSATLVLGPWGVLSVAGAMSSASDLHGSAASVGYNYQAPSWNFGFTLRRDWRDYAMLGDPPTVTNRKYEGTATFGYSLPDQGGTISLSHQVVAVDPTRSGAPSAAVSFVGLNNQRVSAISYTKALVSGRVSLMASLTRTRDTTSRTEAFVGLTFFLDRYYMATANVRRESDRHSEVLQFTKNQPIGEGLGYQITTGHTVDPSGSSATLLTQAQYNAPAATLRAEYDTLRSPQGQQSTTQRASVAGSVVYVGGETALGRPVTDSFGIVKVGDVPGVKVMVAAQDMGRTDAQGKLLVPTLNSYYDNEVSIASDTVPIEYEIAATSKKVSPSARGGAIIDFGAKKIQAFSGVLKYQRDSGPQPVAFQEITLHAGGKSLTLQTGKAGEFYFENLAPGSYAASALVEGKQCPFEILIPKSTETFVELPEVVCRPTP